MIALGCYLKFNETVKSVFVEALVLFFKLKRGDNMLKKLITSFVLVVFSILGISTANAAVELKGDPKIALIYLSPAHDGGWTESIERGRLILEKKTGLKAAYTEDVSGTKTKTRQVVDLYVKRGYNIIIGTAWDYGEAFAEAAVAYPNVAFLNAAGETSGVNLESFYARTYQGWYLAGMAAAGVTKTKKLGMVAGFPLAVVNWDINAFQRGAQAVDPDIQVVASFVNTWFDPVKEGQAAKAMIEQGADVIATDLSAASVPAAAEKAGVRFVGFQNDMSHLAPKGHVTSVIFNWDTYLVPNVKEMIAGTWTSKESSFVGIDQGMIALSGLADDVPTNVRVMIQNAQAAMKSGVFTPFDGPVYKQDGSMAAKKGSSLSDSDLWSMKYFVKGIIGTMPAE
jgi:basic membrane protein A and related proteins